jgi:VanZ family protein
VKRGEASGSDLAGLWRALTDRFGNWLVAVNALALMLASWTPGNYVVRSGFSGHLEHIVAYGLSGVFLFAVLAARCTAWQVAVPLVANAGILELGQLVVPGRHSGIDDFLFSAAGAVVGVLACAALHRRFAPRTRGG